MCDNEEYKQGNGPTLTTAKKTKLGELQSVIRQEIESMIENCQLCQTIKQRTGLMLVDSRELSKQIALRLMKEYKDTF